MRLTFTKRTGKFDDLLIERDDMSPERIGCPKQGIIPHDMVHFAVEKVVGGKGFLYRLLDGKAAGFRMTSEDGAEAIERLVETMQAEAWSGRTPSFCRMSPKELIAFYEASCAARAHPSLPVTTRDVDLIRREIDVLTDRWSAVPVNGAITLTLGGVAETHSVSVLVRS